MVKSYTKTNRISIPPMPQFDASVPAKDIEPTMIKIRKREHAPLRWIVRRPKCAIRNHEPIVPINPRAREIMLMLKDWMVGSPAFCMKYALTL